MYSTSCSKLLCDDPPFTTVFRTNFEMVSAELWVSSLLGPIEVLIMLSMLDRSQFSFNRSKNSIVRAYIWATISWAAQPQRFQASSSTHFGSKTHPPLLGQDLLLRNPNLLCFRIHFKLRGYLVGLRCDVDLMTHMIGTSAIDHSITCAY